MVTEVAENIYRIGIPLPGNPLQELNSYFLRGKERNLLIDTGFRRPECREVLLDGLAQMHTVAEATDLYITHFHADHMGLAEETASRKSAIYTGERDLEYLRQMLAPGGRYDRADRFVREGFPREALERFYASDPSMKMNVARLDARFTPLQNGAVLRVGSFALEVLQMPGHTPGNTMLWLNEQKIMFTGDHILFDISPNITFWENVEDTLGDYLQSLERAKAYPVKTALAGHRGSGNYRERIDALLAHHERRIAEMQRLIGNEPGLCAYELAGRMRWKIRADGWEDFPLSQKWFATGECLAHLDHMRTLGMITREEKKGVWRYHISGKSVAE